MNFSYEEIFSMYGQYDTFVTLDFNFESEASRTYKRTLMGTFIYSLEERERLQQLIQTDNIPRTNRYIRFAPSPLEELSPQQIELLDRKGIQNSNIAVITTINLPRQNHYIVKGEKDIPNTVELKFDSRGLDLGRFKLGLYDSRLRNNHKLIPEEELEYLGLQLFYSSDQFDDDLKKNATDEATGKIKEPIRYYQLKAKSSQSYLTKEEEKEFFELLSRRLQIKSTLISEELKR